MKKITTFVVVSALAVSLAGCQNMSKQDVGVVTGGAIGGLVGSAFGGGQGKVLMAVGGAIAGAVIGGMIGKNMDKTDQLQAQQALENNKTGQATTWKNPDSGNTYTVKPVKTVKKSNTYCREYITTATVAGKTQQIYGTACRQPDGTWKVQK